MLKTKYFVPSIYKNLSVNRACFSSKATDKILGYQEKPDQFEITADCIGEFRYFNNFFGDFLCKQFSCNLIRPT